MPKVISRGIVSSSDDRAATPQSRLIVHYCLCGEFILVMDIALHLLPRRRTDGAYILRNCDSLTYGKKRVYKLNATPDKKAVMVARRNGFERQARLRCPRCDLMVGYETMMAGGKPIKGDYTYLISGALTDNQSVAPIGVFDEEPASTLSVGLETGSETESSFGMMRTNYKAEVTAAT